MMPTLNDFKGLGIPLFSGAACAFGIFVQQVRVPVGLDSREVSREAVDMARHGKLTPELSCAAQAKLSSRVNDYFAGQAAGGKQNPAFVITKQDCIDLMTKKGFIPN